MKTILLTMLFVIMLLVSTNVSSQKPERFPKIHDRILQAKLREIKQKLNLDETEFEEFRLVYVKYDREISQINFRDLAKLNRVDTDSLSADDANRMIVKQIEAAKGLILIREKYSKEFRSVITPQQIIKLYQTEVELRRKVMQEIKRRMMSRFP